MLLHELCILVHTMSILALSAGTHFAASAALRSLSWRITGKPAGYTSTLGRLAPGGQQAGMRLRESDTPAALLATGLDQQLSAVMNAAAEGEAGLRVEAGQQLGLLTVRGCRPGRICQPYAVFMCSC